MGLDVGKARIGVALSDSLGKTAQPYTVVKNDESTLGVLGEIARKEAVEKVVVGLPLLLDGRESEQSRFSRGFAERLAGELEIPVEFFDERLSSAQAEKVLMEARVKPARRKSVSDMIAAALILRDYIEAVLHKEGPQKDSKEDERETIQ